jgi:hypothetical protein
MTAAKASARQRGWDANVAAVLAAALGVLGAAVSGCGTGNGASISEADDPEALNPHNCADIFAPTLLPTFEIQIASGEWDALNAEFQDWKLRQDQSLDLKPYHPVVFRYGDEVVEDAFIKLQGNPSTNWTGNKMGFTVAFDKIDDTRRFHGLRKVVFHTSTTDQTFLRERVALSYLRGLGLPAACENNSRLIVNGQYYGIYANREAADEAFLTRVFPGADAGDLWKGGYELDTNKSIAVHTSHDQLMTTPTLDTMSRLVDLDETLLDWAAEAVMPDSDGYWSVDHNFYLYEHPTRGFLWVPYDVDATFDFAPFNADPVTWVPSWSKGWGVHQQLVMGDPTLTARYTDTVARALTGYDVEVLRSRLLRWESQIAASVADDQQKPFSTADHQLAVGRMSGSFWLRSKYLSSWLDCIKTGSGEDADHDGFIWCRDCNDGDAAQNPAAAEICGNDVDENCNGRKDDCN